MKRIISLFLLFLTLVTVRAQRDLNVVFVGNSITFGALHKNPSQTAPPVVCAQWLSQLPDVGTCYEVNMGKSGRTTFNFVPAKTDGKNYWDELKSRTADLVAAHPQAQLVFSIMLGTNDAAERPSNSRTTPYMYRHNLQLIIDSLLMIYPQAQFVLHRPIFFSAPFTTRNGSLQNKKSQQMLTVYFKQVPRIARCFEARHPGQVHEGDGKAYNYFKKHYLTDLVHEQGYQNCDFWLHPNEHGSSVLAEYWGRAIAKSLGLEHPIIEQ
ncbi:MAG: GDSL-type esterase/lipase family protein [Bacteroidota bacterium]|nr:GDSL-type esterase/lipase family protein [Bacteroidota bacterium]